MSIVNASEWHRLFAGIVFHCYDYSANPEPLVELVDLYRRTFEGVTPLDARITANRTGSQRQRELKPNERNWRKVYDELGRGGLHTLVFGSIEPHITVGFQMSRHYSWTQALGDEGLWTSPDEISFSVEDDLLARGGISLDLFQELMERVWERLEGIYGLADMFIGHRTGLASLREEAQAPRVLRGFHLFGLTGGPIVDYRHQVPGAYWLNFLNARHVATLGGPGQLEQKLKEQFPQPDIRLLPQEGLSIRISANPDYQDTETWEKDHRKIRDILAPLIPPDPRV